MTSVNMILNADPSSSNPENASSLIKDLRMFSGAKSRVPRAVLLDRAEKAWDESASAELGAHRLALNGDVVESARQFIAMALDDVASRDEYLRIAAGLLKKTRSGRGRLAKEFIAQAPQLSSSKYLYQVALRILGASGVDDLAKTGVFSDNTRIEIDREKLRSARRLLSSAGLTDSTLAFIRALSASRVMNSKFLADQVVELEAAIHLSCRLNAMRKSDHPHIRDAAERLAAVAAAKKLPSPADVLARIRGKNSRRLDGNAARLIASIRALSSAVYEGQDLIVDEVVEALLNDVSAKATTPRGGGLLAALTLAGRSVRFWTDDVYRNATVQRFLQILGAEDNEAARLLRARLSMAQGNIAGYETAIASLSEEGEAADNGYLTYVNLEEQAQGRLVLPPEIHALVPRHDQNPDHVVGVACADIRYFRRYAGACIETHSAVSSGNMPHLHVMTDASHHSELVKYAKSFPGLSISVEAPAIEAPFYYATNRFLQIENLSRVVGQPIVVVDIDVAFVADVSEPRRTHNLTPDIMFRINDQIRIFDMSAHQPSYDFPRLDAWSLVPAGYVYAADTILGRKAASIIAAEASFLLGKFADSGRTNWWIDQNVLFRALHRIRSELPTAKLENIANYGLPYKWRRPDGAELRKALGAKHPIYRKKEARKQSWIMRILKMLPGSWLRSLRA